MNWNWQHLDWPEFTWDAASLRRDEEAFLVGGGVILGSLQSVNERESQALIVESMTDEAITTSAIEGEDLDRDSVQSSVQRQLGLAVDDARAKPGERGIAEMMVMLHRTVRDPLDETTLCRWHALVMQGRRDVREVGRYRTHAEPMQVVSGRLDRPTVHFEAPPSDTMPAEMARFLAWFERTGPSGAEPLPALTRAGLAHLWFVTIHPFEDGNGRIARAIAEKALAQAFGQPTLIALAATILERRKAYYDMLEQTNRTLDVGRWLQWFAGIALEAQQRSQARVVFVLEKTKLMDRLRGQINERQEKALLRMLREGPKGFAGGLSAGNYQSITGASPATARRDLNDLVDKQALRRTGERKHTRYYLAIGATETGVSTTATPNSEISETPSK